MQNDVNPVSAPRGAAETHPPDWLKTVRQGLQVASQLIVASPLGLPAKVVTAAKYVSLILGIWDAVDQSDGDEDDENPISDAP